MNSKHILRCALCVSSASLVSCASDPDITETQNPTPGISSLSPDSAVAGVDSAVITVIGDGFIDQTTVSVSGSPTPAVVRSATELVTTLPAAQLAQAGTLELRVESPPPGGGASDPVPFRVTPDTVVGEISLAPAETTLVAVGQTFQIESTPVSGSTGRPILDKVLGWESSEESVAVVDEEGLVTAVGNGAATITATADDVDGTMVVVVAQAPVGLAFTTQPRSVDRHAFFERTVRVAFVDENGHPVGGWDGTIEVSLMTDGSEGSLNGTTTLDAADGVADFTDLSIDRAGEQFTLVAHSTEFESVESNAFDVRLVFLASQRLALGLDHSCAIQGRDLHCWGKNDHDQLGADLDEELFTPERTIRNLRLGAVSTGPIHSCGLTVRFIAYCWGPDAGRLGGGPPPGPVRVSETRFVQITVAHGHACAVDETDKAWCWGSNFRGQLGHDEGNGVAEVVGGLRFRRISAGREHTCAITLDSLAYCWGFNFFGQLGDGSNTDRNDPGLVSVDDRFIDIASGDTFTCAITADNLVKCWGRGADGHLGNNSVFPSNVPVLASTSVMFRSITAGSDGACAIAVDDAVSCWGRSDYGATGTGLLTDVLTPTQIAHSGTFLEVRRGQFHACGRTTDGEVFCWGRNDVGQVGTGPSEFRESAHQIETSVDFQSVVTGGGFGVGEFADGAFSCGLSTVGEVWCWGWSRYGLGDGTQLQRSQPTRVSDLTFQSLGAGSHLCGLTGDGEVYCWGDNGRGQVGDGSDEPFQRMPTRVTGDHTFVSLSVGDRSACALDGAGAAWCWGSNQFGQLGDGSTDHRSEPVQVSGNIVFESISTRQSHSCGVEVGGAAWCWGRNQASQLGDGTSNQSLVPSPVNGGHQFSQLNALRSGSCGRLTTGESLCWGDIAHSSVPMPVFNDAVFSKIVAGAGYHCAIFPDMNGYCWGRNQVGQLGLDNDRTTTRDPTQIPNLPPLLNLSTGPSPHTCAVTTANTIFCWGDNQFGQVGDGTALRLAIPRRVRGLP